MNLAFIIIGRNEAPRLQRCLASAAPFSPTLIYVDSGSSDNSIPLAHSLNAHVIELTPPFSAAKARNAGFTRLLELSHTTETVMFLDGDTELLPNFIPAALQALEDRPDVAIVCGRRRERFPEASLYNRLCDHEWDTPLGETLACGGDALMRVTDLRTVGGFDETIIAGEEPELCHRLRLAGRKVLRIDSDMTLHDAHITSLGQFLRRQIRSGYGGLDVERRTRAGYFLPELRRARLWAAYLPLSILLAAVSAALFSSLPLTLLTLLLVLAYPLQFLRLMLTTPRRGIPKNQAALYALTALLTKFPNALGQLRYLYHHATNQKSKIIEYHPPSKRFTNYQLTYLT